MLGRAARLTIAGLVPGIVAALVVARILTGLPFGISGTDALTFATVGGAMMLASLLAALVPARRATRIDPIQALRAE